ncbi:MAG: UDP-N-acetylmuramoyl-L-alanyl-D-glutamate--2,6-diaminopimelate ligase [Lentisphaeria bacterium]|nr:UDP-N-acetylmuramoyl-L-alanyl-D-glutamate--2,6-diaminopimelate ligase [Lentisphaeria bacterium]
MTFDELLRLPDLNPVNDSREVTPCSVFCAINGAKSDGRTFIPAAIKSGAAYIVSDTEIPDLPVPLIKVDDSYSAWAKLCEAAAGYPARSMKFHGVTGTNGKTTIAFLLRHFFANRKCGLISTVEYDAGNGVTPSSNTTPDAAGFQKIISEMKQNAMTDCVMELSSHGLHQHRTGTTEFVTAIFTNLTGDHLDYHHDMESYYQAKKILFSELACGSKIINIDDPFGKRLYQECGGQSVSLQDPAADFYVSEISGTAEGTVFQLKTPSGTFPVRSPLIGLHNVYNVTEAIAAALMAGLSPEEIRNCMSQDFAVPGRLERIALSNGVSAYVDYAHTDDALKRVLASLRPLCKGRLFCVFGCGGDRDRTKRPRMAKAVAEAADFAIVTSDNPRSEKPEEIIREVCTGIPAGFSYETEPDRIKAIHRAASLTRPGDLLLVAGKGHEDYQEICGVRHHMDDRETLRQC